MPKKSLESRLQKGLISVVIATHNRAQLLREAIISVLSQNAENFEIIIVDDASTDETEKIVKSFDDQRIHFFRLEQHAERSAARNLGLTNSLGEFIMFLDDDDLLRPDSLRILSRALVENRDTVAAVGAMRVYTREGYSARMFHPRKPIKRDVWRELIFGWGAVSGQNLFRTEVIRQIQGFTNKFIPGEDRVLWLKVAVYGKVSFVPQIVLEYRMHPGQIPRPDNIKEIREQIFAEFMTTLPAKKRHQAERIRACSRLAEKAEELRLSGDFKEARKLWFASFRAIPQICFSPLLKTRFYYGIKDALLKKVG